MATPSKLHVIAMQTVVPAMVTEPVGQRRRISGQIRPDMFQAHFHMVWYYKKVHAEEDGQVLTGWMKDSLSRALSENPMLAGRLQLSPEGEVAIAFTDSGVRLVNAQMETTLSEFLTSPVSDEREEAQARLAFWKDIDPHNPQFSALFFIQVTSFQGDGYSIGITCSLLLADPMLMSRFINKWTHTLNTILLNQNDTSKLPSFYLTTNFRKIGDTSPLLIPSPCTTHYRTLFYRLASITFTDPAQLTHAIALFCFSEFEAAFSTLSVIVIDRSGDWNVSTYTRDEGYSHSAMSTTSLVEGALSPTSWDDLTRGQSETDVSFYKRNMPVSASFHIESRVDQGLVLIMPPPVDESTSGITVSITVPK